MTAPMILRIIQAGPGWNKTHLRRDDRVVLKVFDILGKEVKTLVNEELQPGEYSVRFDAGDLPSGVYLYRLQAGEFTETRKMVLLK